jgi:hypothetical protein
MPYIEKEDKKALDRSIAHLSTELRNGDFRGRLNYLISSIFSNMVQANGLSYRLINDYIGVLECAKLEAYRRIAVPYEDGKIVSNGDIYPPAKSVQTHCLKCGVKADIFSDAGLCKDCILKDAGYDENIGVIKPQDKDIEEVAQNHKSE